MFRKLLAAAIAAAALISVAVTLAAEPANGTLSNASPSVSWKGTVSLPGATYNAWAQDPSTPADCTAPTCDAFALTLAEPHDVTFKLNIQASNTAGGDPGGGIRLVLPDKTYQYIQGPAGEKTTLTWKLKGLKAGAYEVDVVDSHVCCSTDPYTMTAEITGAKPTTTATPGAGPVVVPTATPSGPTTTSQVTIKAAGASAKKVTKAKKYRFSVTSSGPLTKVAASLRKGKKVVAKAKINALQGTVPVTVKLAKKVKLKAGAYTVVVSGTDSQGHAVSASAPVKFKK